ncbi:glycosyltransferase family 2 protein [Streptomyces malaysiensis subsp. malaysiensis]|uniref:glycosyltransferase family 2 protein n=1 Tax=Streptomyces malaysiensis TaxID=92644 RepID=UPI000BFBB0BB|nr:glycosyltransferase family 2 protein [Streptomyces malaysiensis]ATL83372.1 integral membrane regulatory protein [Streptomyces malaysiensis]QDL72479.1 glycosyltransferase family 2 protein [Streptomyces malaysiensis]
MSVHSHSAAQYPAATAAFAPAQEQAQTPAYPRHVVTAVLVAHDGARWLPDALSGLLGQERPVQSVVAADTGSADDSARLLTETLGEDRVLHMARRSGFGTAVAEAVRTAPVLGPEELAYLKRPSGWDPVNRTWRDDAYDMPELPHGEPIQWLWLLHDDCAPEPDALAELLRVVDAEFTANREPAIVGPKLRGWYDRRQLLEVGVSIARSGRRWTGLERREQDQGQHDQVRPVLSVSSAGMLVRRDVWEQLGGFDSRLPLMRDDVDLCWRAQAAGHQVLIAPDAVLRHAEASARERRPIDCVGRSAHPSPDHHPPRRRFASRSSSPHRVDKAGAVYTLLVNTRGALLPYVMLRLLLGTLLRTLAYLVGKVPGQALDEVAGLFGVLLRPGRILAARKRRGRPATEPSELRPLFPPPGATVRATVEQVASNIGGRSEPELSSGGRHGAVESGPGDDDADFLEVEQFARLKRVARKPGPMLFLVLLVVSLVACRDLLGAGALAGGALLPAPAHVSDLWSSYVDGWHPVGTGGTQSAPPYLAALAALATVFLGSTGFTLTLLLVCSVPLAGFIAYFASRPLVESRLLRAWGSVAYAFLPAATGALAGGRLGTAVLAVLLPLMARAAAAATGFTSNGSKLPSWRATWAYALLLTFTMAFTPVVWPMALLLGVGVLALRQRQSGTEQLMGYGLRFLSVIVTPLVVLAPWSLDLLTDPARFLEEAGLDRGASSASALQLLALSPGGPKGGGTLLLLGFVLAALAALMRGERQTVVRTAWVVALTGFLFAALTGGSGWAGPATLVYGLALLIAGVVGAEGARERVAAQSFGWRQPVALLIAVATVAAPLYAAVSWMASGADGPVGRRDPSQVPAFVAAESATEDQARTLVLGGGSSAARADYALVRGSGARLGDGELAAKGYSDSGLDGVVANLIAGSGADQTRQLGGYAVRYVYVQKGAPPEMERVLNATPGLTQLSREHGGVLWRVDQRVSRVSIVPAESSGRPAGGAAAKPVHVASGPVEAHTTVPDGAAGRVLRIADRSAPDWQATLDGEPLKPTTVDGWAQGFELPANGGRLDLTYDAPLTHTAWVWAQGLLAVVLLVLALPGRRRNVDDDLPDAESAAAVITAEDLAGDGRRARRLRAAAEAQAAQTGQADAAKGRPEADPAAADALPPQPDALPSQPGGIPPQPGEPPLAPPVEPPAMGDPYGDQAAAHDPYGDQAAAGDPYAAVPHQQEYGQEYGQEYERQWDAQTYAEAGYGQYPAGQYQGEQYRGEGYADQYQAGDYQGGYQDTGYPAGYQDGQYPAQEGQYPADPYAGGQYADPYGYDQQQPYTDGGYPAQGDTTYGGADPEDRRDGSEQQR